MPLISVIVPVYNAGSFLKRCIDSILAQIFNDYELIIINDGSTDDSESICLQFASQDSRIRYINQPNLGVSKTRNNGVAVSRGKYIAFIDADDYILPDYLSELYKNITNNHAEISLVAKVEPEKQNDMQDLKVFDCRSAIEYLGKRNDYKFRVPWGKLIKRDIVIQTPFPEKIGNGEDLFVVYQWIFSASVIVDSNEQLYVYNSDNQGSISNSRLKKKKTDDLVAYEHLLCFLHQEHFNSLHKQFFEDYLLKILSYIQESRLQKSLLLTGNLKRKLKKGINQYNQYFDFNSYSQKNYILRNAYPTRESIKRIIKKRFINRFR